MVEYKSEFGKGLTYCLGLFLAHSERTYGFDVKDKNYPSIWFNGASDHLYELQIPGTLPKSLQDKLKNFQKKCLKLGHGFINPYKATKKDMNWAIDEAKTLLRLIDEHYGVKVKKGEWE